MIFRIQSFQHQDAVELWLSKQNEMQSLHNSKPGIVVLCWGFAHVALYGREREYVYEDCTRGSFKFLLVTTIDLQNAARIIVVIARAQNLQPATKYHRRKERSPVPAPSATTRANLRWEWFLLWRSQWNRKIVFMCQTCISCSQMLNIEMEWSVHSISIDGVNYSADCWDKKVYILVCLCHLLTQPWKWPLRKVRPTISPPPTRDWFQKSGAILRGGLEGGKNRALWFTLPSKKAVEIFGCSPGSSLCTRCMYNLVNFFCIAPCREEADVSCDAYEQFYRKLFQKKVLSHEVDIKK